MTAMSARWRRLAPGLSPQERALLIIRDYKVEQEPDPTLRLTIPEQDRGEVVRLVRLAYAANGRLGWLVSFHHEQVRRLYSELVTLTCIGMWGASVRDLAVAAGLRGKGPLPDYARAAIDRSPIRFLVGKPSEGGSNTADQLASRAEQSLLASLRQAWLDVAALERALVAVATELGGEDPLHPKLRQELTRVRVALDGLVPLVEDALDLTLEMPEPGGDDLELLYQAVEAAVHGAD